MHEYWSQIALPNSHNGPNAFTVVLWWQVETIFCFPAGSKYITHTQKKPHRNLCNYVRLDYRTNVVRSQHSSGFKMQDKSALMHHIICWHTELSTKRTSLSLCRPAQLASCDAMATVVAENTKEAWEVKDPLCVWCVVCVHTCASRWRSWGWKTWFPDVKKRRYHADKGGIQRNKQVVLAPRVSLVSTMLVHSVSEINREYIWTRHHWSADISWCTHTVWTAESINK